MMCTPQHSLLSLKKHAKGGNACNARPAIKKLYALAANIFSTLPCPSFMLNKCITALHHEKQVFEHRMRKRWTGLPYNPVHPPTIFWNAQANIMTRSATSWNKPTPCNILLCACEDRRQGAALYSHPRTRPMPRADLEKTDNLLLTNHPHHHRCCMAIATGVGLRLRRQPDM